MDVVGRECHSRLYSVAKRHLCSIFHRNFYPAAMESCDRTFFKKKFSERFSSRRRHQFPDLLSYQYSQEWFDKNAGSPGFRYLCVCRIANRIHGGCTCIDLFFVPGKKCSPHRSKSNPSFFYTCNSLVNFSFFTAKRKTLSL